MTGKNDRVNCTSVSTCLGHQMPLWGYSSQPDLMQYHSWPLDASTWEVCLTECQPNPKANQMSRWPDIVPLLVTGCLYQGVHLTTGLCDHSSHTYGHRMSLPGEGQVDILFDRQSASQPACHLQLASQPAMWQHVNMSRLWVGQIFGGRGTGSSTTLVPSPGSQHSHWFPLGSDLPVQGKASYTNKLCSLLNTFGTMFRDHLQFCINTYSCM